MWMFLVWKTTSSISGSYPTTLSLAKEARSAARRPLRASAFVPARGVRGDHQGVIPGMPVPDLGPEGVARAKVIAAELVRVMGLDNGVVFAPFPAQMVRLQNAVMSLMEDGLFFSEEDIFEITSGEESEVQAAYGKLYGFSTLQSILTHIFDGPTQ